MEDSKLDNAECPDGRVLMFQLTNMIGNANLENIKAFGVHIDNGEPFLELIQNLLLFIHNHIWMPCDVKLPEDGENVIVFMERDAWDLKGNFYRKTDVEKGWQIGGHWNVEGCSDVKGLAWMPLPEPWDGR